MRKLLIALHALLIATPFLPVYHYDRDLFRSEAVVSPAAEAWQAARRRPSSKSIIAAGLPGFLALLNLPFVLGRRPRWKAMTSLVIGMLSAGLLAKLIARSQSREWGVWAIWGLSMALLIAAVAAWARLPAAPCPRCGKAAI